MDSMATDMPWVYALDLSFDHETQVPNGEHPGYFRVAVDSVISELYTMPSTMTPRELWPGPDNKIWESAFE